MTRQRRATLIRIIGIVLALLFALPAAAETYPTRANGNIAADAVAKSDPDGYTLLLGADSGIVINPHVYSKLPFDPLRDLVPVASVAANQFILAVNPVVPARDFGAFVAHARR